MFVPGSDLIPTVKSSVVTCIWSEQDSREWSKSSLQHITKRETSQIKVRCALPLQKTRFCFSFTETAWSMYFTFKKCFNNFFVCMFAPCLSYLLMTGLLFVIFLHPIRSVGFAAQALTPTSFSPREILTWVFLTSLGLSHITLKTGQLPRGNLWLLGKCISWPKTFSWVLQLAANCPQFSCKTPTCLQTVANWPSTSCFFVIWCVSVPSDL